MNPYILPSFFLVGSISLFVMAYILKNKNKDKTFFSAITGILLLIFSIMGYTKFKNYIVITILIVSYYLVNAAYDIKHKKTRPGAKAETSNKGKKKKVKV